MSPAILILVRTPDEVELARALVNSLPELPFSLAFGVEDLRQRFGPLRAPSTVDLGRLFVAAEPLRLALCFSGARELSNNSNLWWLSFFNELGVPTVEIQREPLQDTAAAARESVARHYLSWDGADGIGDLKTAGGAAPVRTRRNDVVAVSSRLDGESYPEEERFCFVFALLRLARENPAHTFVWRIAPGELSSAEAASFWTLLEKLAPKNLVVDEHEPWPELLARCRSVIGMVSASLLDAAAAGKPGLLFAGAAGKLGPFSARSFDTYAELRTGWEALGREPEACVIRSALPRFSAEAMARRLEALSLPVERAGALDPLPLGLRYMDYFQQGRARAEIGKVSATVNAIERRLDQSSERQHEQLRKALEQLGGLQRSSVAFQALKLLGGVRKRALKHQRRAP